MGERRIFVITSRAIVEFGNLADLCSVFCCCCCSHLLLSEVQRFPHHPSLCLLPSSLALDIALALALILALATLICAGACPSHLRLHLHSRLRLHLHLSLLLLLIPQYFCSSSLSSSPHFLPHVRLVTLICACPPHLQLRLYLHLRLRLHLHHHCCCSHLIPPAAHRSPLHPSPCLL